MEQAKTVHDGEIKRTQIRELVQLSARIVSHYWPMRTFVHHNPLHGLEYLPFEEAVQHGYQYFRGKGYLSCEIFRDYARSGRILPHDINAVLKPLAHDKYVMLGKHKVTHFELLQLHMLRGIFVPAEETLEAQIMHHRDRFFLESLADHINEVLQHRVVSAQGETGIREDQEMLGRHRTLADWCDCFLNTRLANEINQEMIKWCEAFLDEGHAAWAMPCREYGFYGAWKFLAGQEWHPCMIPGSHRKLASLSEHPEDTLVEHLTVLKIPDEIWQDYLTLHLAALPGWTGYIKWRSVQSGYEWQEAYPADLVQYLAVRIWYERELVHKACSEQLGIDGDFRTISADMQKHPLFYFLQRERNAGKLSAVFTEQVDQLRYWQIHSNKIQKDVWQYLDGRSLAELTSRSARAVRYKAAWQLYSLAKVLEIEPGILAETVPEDLLVLVEWLDAFPESAHGPLWLKAFEASYQKQLIGKLSPNISYAQTNNREVMSRVTGKVFLERLAHEDILRIVRPQAQVVFCIDVRSESFRRHLETVGNYETFGFAGFFSLFIRYRALDSRHETNQFPVITEARNTVRELPRTYQGQFFHKRLARAELMHAGYKLLHDLKENVITPYVMVESTGWFYSLPLIGKTFFKTRYRHAVDRLLRAFIPPIATTITVDQLSRYEVQEMLAAEQRDTIQNVLKKRFGNREMNISPELPEILRLKALDENAVSQQNLSGAGRLSILSTEEEAAFLEELRRDYRINRSDTFERMERIIKTGINFQDQVTTMETALRIMGMTKNFARLVLFCAHGSTSENNPFEAALDCGACGGNAGSPNARLLATMANKPLVREHLARNGISIPRDTYFIAGQHNTTTDEVQLFDLEDLPHTHQNDLFRLVQDLREAGHLNSQERCSRFPEIKTTLKPRKAAQFVYERSCDWSQIRPEWGLSGNAAFIIGNRKLSKGVDLEGRVFLHSYDYREDPEGQFLNTLMTAPQVVGQWINMEHYFSTVDNEVYGSGNKIYHNVVGRLGVMSGPQSDLRIGLPWQTMWDGHRPYHEPMRLFTLIEAPRETIIKIIGKHRILQHYYDNEWVHLVALDPEEKAFYRYIPKQGWKPLRDE